MASLEQPRHQQRFLASVCSTVKDVRGDPDKLFQAGDSYLTPSVSCEAQKLRDAIQGLHRHDVKRAVVKLSFLWHRDMREIFPHIVAEGVSHVGVVAHKLVDDMAERAEAFATAMGVPCASVDLLCSRFAPGSAPVHVDYGEFLKDESSALRGEDRRCLSLVMPYVGPGTEYLIHSRDLVERKIKPEVILHNNSARGLGETLHRIFLEQSLEWVPTNEASYTVHRNGVALHRAPSSSEFRLLLAIDCCITDEQLLRPLDLIRERIIRNARVLRGLREKMP